MKRTVLIRFGLAALVITLAAAGYWKWSMRGVGAAGEQSGTEGWLAAKHEQEKSEIVAKTKSWEETVWAEEVLAQEYEDTFVRLWDELRAATDKYAVLGAFPVGELIVGEAGAAARHSHGITRAPLDKAPKPLDASGRNDWLAGFKEAGYRIVQSEWHHRRFERNQADGRARSIVNATLHVTGDSGRDRFIVSGPLTVHWSAEKHAEDGYRPEKIDATAMKLTRRTGQPAFEEWTGRDGGIPTIKMGNDPVITFDLDGDGLSELVLPEQNAVYRNRGGGRFEVETLCAKPAFDPRGAVKQVGAAALADLTGDGHADLVLAGNEINVVLFEGTAEGAFPGAGRVVFEHPYNIKFPSVIAVGDVNGDRLLDMWVAQIKPAYGLGTMPSPYYDANDGFASFLLVNEGGGQFSDKTDESGLAEKRYRRTFSASFVDLDDDNDLDLMVVSDFAGLDLHENDGKGGFTDVTRTWVDEKSNFGMGHTLGDYDRDGRLDFYVTGMSSTTARRLEAMNAGIEDQPEIHENRMRMGYGSRMYLARDGKKFLHPDFRDSLARSGWSWGATSFDLSNNGLTDIYVANGNLSGTSCKDYCTKFWTRDIYLGNSRPNPALQIFFDEESERTKGQSWNGYEKNAFFLNEGDDFLSVGFLLDVAFEYDSRALVSDDLDADGRVDLLVLQKIPDKGIVASLASNAGVRAKVGRLHIYRNQWKSGGNWIGVRLRDEPGRSTIGAKIYVRTEAGTLVAHCYNGDSFSSQHSNQKHFGLGDVASVKEIEVRWPDGTIRRLENPAIQQYHQLSADR